MPATPLLGREAELAELGALLQRDHVRMVTLTGPGGSGKTRLALAAAGAAADEFVGGVWWVPLASLRDPALVLESAARAIGAAGDLAEHIGDTRLLLLMDNFEHLTGAAPNLAVLLARCPNLTVLVTSREPLHLAGEHEYAVDPLHPDEAVELFLTRAVAAKRDFIADGEVELICERLDHLPLAIELAAARVKLLSPSALLARLEQRLPLLTGGTRDAPDRQRTLHATIEWSHELLTDDEQRLFAQLAVFRGGWTLEAAEAIAEADLDTLQSLVDKSLIRVRDTGRFWMLETIREYALERLETSGDGDEARDRHGAFFLALVEEAEPHVKLDDAVWLDRLEVDADNLRAALDRLEASGDGLQRLAGSLWRWWYSKSRESEGRRRIESALAADTRPSAARLKLLLGASVMSLGVADPPSAIKLATEARELANKLGDAWSVAYATMMLGSGLADIGEGSEFQAALEKYAEAAVLFEEQGDRHYGLIARHNRAWIVGDLGDPEAEKRMHEEDLISAREIGNEPIEADCLAQLGFFARDEGRLEEARDLTRAALRLDHRRGHASSIVQQLSRLASIYARSGELMLAAQLQSASEALAAARGIPLQWYLVRRQAETLELLRAAGLAGGPLDAALAHGRTLSLEDAVALALGEPLTA